MACTACRKQQVVTALMSEPGFQLCCIDYLLGYTGSELVAAAEPRRDDGSFSFMSCTVFVVFHWYCIHCYYVYSVAVILQRYWAELFIRHWWISNQRKQFYRLLYHIAGKSDTYDCDSAAFVACRQWGEWCWDAAGTAADWHTAFSCSQQRCAGQK